MAPSPGRLSWREIADLQSGVISEHDAIVAGLTRADIRARVLAGAWRQPARGVLITAVGGPPRLQQAWAALLAGGRGAVLGGATAAALDGLTGHDHDVVTVLIPPERRCAPMPGVVFRRSSRLSGADIHRTRLPPRTVPARSVVDMAEWSGEREHARTLIVDALRQGFVTVDTMRRAMAGRGPITRRTLIGDTLDDAARRTPRMLAQLYRQIELAFALPAGRALAADSADAPTGRLDVWYGPWRLLVRIGQSGPRQARPAGRLVLAIPTERLWQAPEEVAALVTAGLGSQVPAGSAVSGASDPGLPEPTPGPGTPGTPGTPRETDETNERDETRREWHEPVRDEPGEGDQGGGGGQLPAVASRQMRELPPWGAERAAGQRPVPPTA
ncbi:hypothetical protein [Frankia elaeagni]